MNRIFIQMKRSASQASLSDCVTSDTTPLGRQPGRQA